MNALVLGAGLQGKAVIHDLSRSELVDRILVADLDLAAAQRFLDKGGYHKVRAVQADALDPAVLRRLISENRSDIVVCMLPAHLSGRIAEVCVECGVPFVNTSYAQWLGELDQRAREKGVILLPEMGFDPGIDLIVGRMALDELDQVEGFYSYGGGLPEPAACDNPLNYKITWTFDGVLKAYCRPARLLRQGRAVEIPGDEIFQEENIHFIEVPELGRLEAYPNGDATRFVEVFGLGPELKEMGRFATRWPGHSAFWRIMAKLGFLGDQPVELGEGVSVSPREFLVKLLEPRLQFRENERDVVVLRVKVWGRRGGRKRAVTYDLVDYRDLATGLFAMNRTVGFAASIGAQMVLKGEITGAGVLSPVKVVDGQRFLDELAARGIKVQRRLEEE